MNFILFLGILLSALGAKAQDPHFTQFYAAPLTVNPAYTGVFTGQMRVMSNYRQQWINSTSPYNTVTLAMDARLRKGEEENPFNLGFMLMNDNSLNGALKSTYAMGTASYHVLLDEDGFASLGAGLSASYGSRKIDFSSITFSNQFTSGGFNASLPSGETGLSNMKPFLSVGTGVLFQYNNGEQGSFFDLGVSEYHVNKPEQTTVNDQQQYVPVRLSIQSSFQKYVNDGLLLNIKALYQQQAAVSYILGGVSLEQMVGTNKDYLIGGGLWYRTKDSFSPYVRLGMKQFIVGVSYDVGISGLKKIPKPARSWEMSFQYMLNKPYR